MNFDFSITPSPHYTAELSLRTVFMVEADASYDVHKNGTHHKDLVALRTIKGMGEVTIEGQTGITVTPGSLLLFEHDKVRRYYCCGDTWDFWWFEFSCINPIGLHLNQLYNIDPAGSELDVMTSCLHNLKKSDPPSLQLASAYLSLLIYQWAVLIQANLNSNPYQAAVDKAIGFMRNNLSRNVSVSEMAKTAGFSERRFRQIFEQVTGSPPKRYYDALRIEIAKNLLKSTPLSIGDISRRLGYSSQFHFTHEFIRVVGIQPSVFRKVS